MPRGNRSAKKHKNKFFSLQSFFYFKTNSKQKQMFGTTTAPLNGGGFAAPVMTFTTQR
jgi:hypothetical protein